MFHGCRFALVLITGNGLVFMLCGLFIGLPALVIIWFFGERLRRRARESY
jgi:hypothetical protein